MNKIIRMPFLFGLLVCGMLFFNAKTASAQSQTTCATDPVPAGWRITDAYQQPNTCGLGIPGPGNFLANKHVITRYDNTYLGHEMEICTGQSVPSGWTLQSVYINNYKCGAQIFPPNTYPVTANVMLIKNTSSPPPPAPTFSPVGRLDGIGTVGRNAYGWSYDPDSNAAPNMVHFYIGTSTGPTTFIGQIMTHLFRNDSGIPAGNHGYNFYIPEQYFDNTQHYLYAYGLDVAGGNAPAMLTGSPIAFNFAPIYRKAFDFDGDNKADISVFRPSTGDWWRINSSNSSVYSLHFGATGDIPVAADYDGDGKADISVFRPSDGTWHRLSSSDGTYTGTAFGSSGDIPTTGDFDFDKKADIALFRPSDHIWYRLNSTDGSFYAFAFGLAGDIPTAADYDGDGRADISLFRPSDANWYRINSSNGQFVGVYYGATGDIPTLGDFDGDGKADIAVFHPANGTWNRINSSNGQTSSTSFGSSGDIPTPADYDGDGKRDISVFRPSDTIWYRLNSSNGQFVAQQFGAGTDIPVSKQP